MEEIEENVHPAQHIAEVIQRIWNAGLTTASGGNITVRDKSGDIWATPASVDKASLTKDEIVSVSQKSNSGYKPTSELPFHQAIYRKRKDIHAVIHAHPPALTAFSMLRSVPETDIISDIKRICGSPTVDPYQISGSNELADSLSEEFRKGHDCITMENHATVVGGGSLQEALQHLETFELCAGIIINGSKLGNIRKLTADQLKSKNNTHVAESNLKQKSFNKEAELRELICSYTRRCYNQGLMISSIGTISLRLEKNSILITPFQTDRSNIRPEDIVKIENGKAETGNTPDPSVNLHLSVYKKHPDIHSIIQSKPTFTMAFGITGKRIDTRTTPESFVMAGEIPLLPFSAGEEKVNSVTGQLSQNIHCLVIENDELIVTGGNVLQSYERLEVVESTAKSLIYSTQIGNALPIPENDLSKLETKFLH